MTWSILLIVVVEPDTPEAGSPMKDDSERTIFDALGLVKKTAGKTSQAAKGIVFLDM